MSFEVFIFRAQTFAAKLQGNKHKPGSFLWNLQMSLGAMLTQILMTLAFGKVLAEGEKQWRKLQKQKSATVVNKKSGSTKKPVQNAGLSSRT
jgi:hypothetical protein